MFLEKTKYIDVRLDYIRDIISQGQARVEKISALTNPTDMLTKAIPLSRFRSALNLLNMLPT